MLPQNVYIVFCLLFLFIHIVQDKKKHFLVRRLFIEKNAMHFFYLKNKNNLFKKLLFKSLLSLMMTIKISRF